MDVTRERISCILELREILLSFQTGFNLVSAAVACAILDSILSLEQTVFMNTVWEWCLRIVFVFTNTSGLNTNTALQELPRSFVKVTDTEAGL